MKWTDLILIVGLLATSVFFITTSKVSNGTVIIQYENKVIGRYPIDINKKVTFEGALGEMAIEIKNGKVRMIESKCPLQLCIKQGWISSPSVPIVCVPNKVIVYIKNNTEQDLMTK
jgi:hypothetical protein